MKRLNIVYFVDSKSSKSFFLTLGALVSIVLFLLTLAGLSVYSFTTYLKQKSVLSERNEYIKDLKIALIAENQMSRKIFSEEFLKENYSAEELNLVSKRIEKSLNRKVSSETGKEEEPTDALKVLTASKQELSPKKIDLSVVSPKKPTSGDMPAPKSPNEIYFANFVIVATGDETSVVKFDIHNKTPGVRLSGHICMLATTSQGKVSLPANLKVEGESPLGCQRGEFVSFARLRPTELKVAAAKPILQKFQIFFVPQDKLRPTYQQSFEIPKPL